MTQISSDMNIIEEAVKDPKELTELLEETINGKNLITRYLGLRVIVQLIGKKGFTSEKVSSLVPLIKAIE